MIHKGPGTARDLFSDILIRPPLLRDTEALLIWCDIPSIATKVLSLPNGQNLSFEKGVRIESNFKPTATLRNLLKSLGHRPVVRHATVAAHPLFDSPESRCRARYLRPIDNTIAAKPLIDTLPANFSGAKAS
ncbi:hypothetical protein VTJ04DRAFT_809 [Mycothermus thermophilus]|uniref:uncharacterized protein n=1 Tax=Humicola insolens TaxID=85995 RepID=UPI003742C5AB